MSWKGLKALTNAPTCWSTPAQLGVLFVIADKTNDEGDPSRGIPAGFAWPSKATIAERIGVSSRYVPDVVHELEVLGLLEVRRGAGPRGSNLYRLTLPTSAVQFTPSDADQCRAVHPSTVPTSAVQFTHSPAGPVNCDAPGGELQSTGGMNHTARGGVLPSSPERSTELLNDPDSERVPDALTQVLTKYAECLRRHTGDSPSPSDDDVRTLQRILNTHGLGTAVAALEAFFSSRDAFVRERGFPLRLLEKQVTQVLAAAAARTQLTSEELIARQNRERYAPLRNRAIQERLERECQHTPRCEALAQHLRLICNHQPLCESLERHAEQARMSELLAPRSSRVAARVG